MHKSHDKKHDGKDVKSNLEIALEKAEKMTTGTQSRGKEARKEAHLPEEELRLLREKAAKADEYYDRLLRAAADLENYKKRAERERSDIIKFAHEEIMSDLIVVLDNFERALQAAETSADPAQLAEGVKLIRKQLLTVLQKYGLRPIEAIGKPFNPEFHEAVAQVETDEHPEGTVLTEQLKGYTLDSRLLRPSVVVTSKKSAAAGMDEKTG
jgi:molecular chaperone GrpE